MTRSMFPETRVSIIAALADADADGRRIAADLLVRAYRAPLLDGFKWRWNLTEAEAEDLVQDFFAAALEKNWLARYDPARARFRTFLRVCADRFAANRRQAAARQRRGGGVDVISFDGLDQVRSLDDDAAEARFRREWVRSIFTLAVDALRVEAEAGSRHSHFALFESYDLADAHDAERPTYAALARTHGLTESQVLNQLAWARRRLRVHVLEVLRKLAGSKDEYRADVRDLLGIEAP